MKDNRGFSLTELMVVVSTISLLMAVSIPALISAKSQTKAVVCRSNLRQLVLANVEYAGDNKGFYVPAAEDLWRSIGLLQGGYYRWHGKRNAAGEPFDPSKGPLADYLGDGKVKECPAKADFTKDLSGLINFEKGCGGYGYNMRYLGSLLWCSGLSTPAVMKSAYARTTNVVEVRRPAVTLMFCDTAFVKDEYVIEYSFAEPPYLVVDGEPIEPMNGLFSIKPSIHFRHRGWANIGWADGHIEPRQIANMKGKPGYDAASASVNIGWFEPVDNSAYDLH